MRNWSLTFELSQYNMEDLHERAPDLSEVISLTAPLNLLSAAPQCSVLNCIQASDTCNVHYCTGEAHKPSCDQTHIFDVLKVANS